MIDSDLAALFGVQTRVFNQAIRRNRDRFPPDFIFELTPAETAALMSQIVISNEKSKSGASGGRGGRRKPPLVFTEHGAITAATLLRSKRAVAMSVYVVRAFVRMRDEIASNLSILRRLAEVDKKLIEHDLVLGEVVSRLQPLLAPAPEKKKPKIGYHSGNR